MTLAPEGFKDLNPGHISQEYVHGCVFWRQTFHCVKGTVVDKMYTLMPGDDLTMEILGRPMMEFDYHEAALNWTFV